MKQKIKALISVVLCLMLMFQSVNINAATKVKINKTKASIYVGKTVQLKITGTKKKVTWKSSNKKVATVTSKGKVKGIKKGTAKITATVSKKKYTCKVTVKNKAIKATPTPKPTVMVTPTPTQTPVTTSKVIVPTEEIVTPTVTPTVAPETNTIADNINKLKKYITENGSKNSSGNKFIKWVDNDILICQYAIIYENDTDKLHFLTSVEGDDSNATISMYVDPVNTKNVFPELICIIGDDFAYKAVATVDMDTYTSDTNVAFKNVDGSNLDEYLQELSNSYLRVSFSGWNILLYDRLNIGMKDIGFSAYGKEETTTPTETPIITTTPIVTATPTIAPTEIAVEAPTPTNSASYDTAYVNGKYTELKDYIYKNGESLSSKSKCIKGTSQLVSGEAIAYNIQYNGTKFAFVAYTDSFWCRFYIDALNNNYSEITVMTLNDDSYTATSYFEASKFLNEDSYLDTLEWGINRASFNNDESKKYAKEVFSLSVNYCEQLLNEKLNMTLKDLGIGTGIIYVENVVTPTPWITPSPTPKPQTIEERYDVAKEYFKTNGTKSDDENNFTMKGTVKSNSKNYEYTITYKNDTNEFYALIVCEYVRCSFTFNILNTDEVNVKYNMTRWEPRYAGHQAITTFNASEYNSNDIYIWETTGSSFDEVYTPDDKKMSKEFHEAYDIADFVFEDTVGLSLEDLGFGENASNDDNTDN